MPFGTPVETSNLREGFTIAHATVSYSIIMELNNLHPLLFAQFQSQVL